MDNFNVSMYEYYLNHTERLGNASKALVFYGKYLSRQQFVSEVNIFANFLVSVGIKKGDNVLLCLGNIPNAIVCFYAINSIGAIVNVTHPLIAGNNLQQIATTMNSKAFIVFDEFCNKYQWLFSQEKPVVICSASDYLPIVAKQVYPLMIAKKTKCIRYSENIVKYRDIKKNSIKQKEKFVDKNVNDKENNVIDNIIDESNIVDDKNVINNKNIVDKENNNVVVGNDTAVFMHSGGTSGQPKTVEMSNEAFNHLVANMRAHIGGDLTDKDGMLMALPIFHTFGLGICMHTMLCLGGQCVLMPKFDGKKACHLIKKYNCTFISGVPNMYRKIVFCGKFKGKKIAKIKSCYCGGDKLSKDVFDKFAQQMKTVGRDLNISEGYGLTEACICAINKLDNFKFGSVGLAAQGSQFEVVDEARNFVGTNKVGELALCCNTMMKGYYGDKKATEEAFFVGKDGKKWLLTGDMGYIDDDDFIFFVDRKKRLIKISGINVFPQEIENIVDKAQGVQRSCVVGMRCQGKVFVKLFVQLVDKNVDKDIVKQSIYNDISNNLLKYCLPRVIEFVDSFPLTQIGKIDYRALEERE